MAGSYRRVEIEVPFKPLHDEEPEREFWERYTRNTPFNQSQSSSVSCIDFSPINPFDIAVTASTRVSIYDGRTLELRHSFSRFKSQAFSGRFRSDGKLLVAGSEEGIVKIFDSTKCEPLRTWTGHRGPVRAARFAADRTRVVSGGDDGSIREYDISAPSETATTRVIQAAHSDHIRAIERRPNSEGSAIWATASYDGTACVWDIRSKNPKVLQLDHEKTPVESVVWFSSGSALATASGKYVKIWDVSSGRTLAVLADYQKTVTCLTFALDGTRLFAGGIDQVIKVYDVQSYNVLHTFHHHAPILSLAISPDDKRIAIGSSDGNFSVMTRDEEAETASENSLVTTNKTPGTVRYFLRGREPIDETEAQIQQRNESHHSKKNNNKKKNQKGAQTSKQLKYLGSYDFLLKKFKYAAALDAALATNNPAVVVGILRELIHRGGLKIALKNRDETTLEPLLVFLVNCVAIPQYSALLVTVCGIVVDLYACLLSSSIRIDELFFKMKDRIDRELKLQDQLLHLMGSLDLLVASAEPAIETSQISPPPPPPITSNS